MRPYFSDAFGNPSSLYELAQQSRHALDEARERCSRVLGARTGEIVFTSGGTESDNAAIVGAALAMRGKGGHVVTTAIEHHAVLHACDLLQSLGFEVTRLPVSRDGIVSVEDAVAAVTERTTVVSVMLANNEIGTIQPVAEIAARVKARAKELGSRVVVHTDAVQGAGYLDLNVNRLDVDMLTLSAHKFHGPKGVGLLYIRRNTPFTPTQVGGAQERDRRAGTENVPAIVGMSVALEAAERERAANATAVSALRDRLIGAIRERVPGAKLNGHPVERLPNNANFSFPGVEGEPLLLGLDLAGVAASSGSACTAASLEPSHVLLALGMRSDLARASLRLTLGPDNTAEEVDYAVESIASLVAKLRSLSAAPLAP